MIHDIEDQKYVGYVYFIYCKISNKFYIGITTQKAERRWELHKNDAYRDRSTNNHFHNAIKKYGWNSFEKQVIIKIVSESQEVLDESLRQLEGYYIEKYDSYYNGYNSTFGGQSVSDVIKTPVLAFLEDGTFIGKYKSRRDAAKAFKICESGVSMCCRRINLSCGFYNGQRLIFRNEDDSYTEKDKCRLKRANPSKPIPVKCYDYETGELIKIYPSYKEAQRETGISADNIRACTKGKCKRTTIGGKYLAWCTMDQNYEKKIVLHVYRNGKKLGEFVSIASAVRNLGLDKRTRNYISERRHSEQILHHRGYDFKFID